MPSYRTIVLDVDGTLVDSNAAHARAWIDALAERGREVPFERVRLLIGMGADNLLPTLLSISDTSDEGCRLAERAGEIFREKYLSTVRPFPRVRALLERLRHDGYSLVVASSASEDLLGKLLTVGGVDDLIEHRVSSTDVHRSKPEPDCVIAALRKTGTSPAEAIMLGDTPYDVAAALRADVGIIGLRCGGWDDDQLAGSIATYADPEALLNAFEQSPLAAGPSSDRRGKSVSRSARQPSTDLRR